MLNKINGPADAQVKKLKKPPSQKGARDVFDASAQRIGNVDGLTIRKATKRPRDKTVVRIRRKQVGQNKPTAANMAPSPSVNKRRRRSRAHNVNIQLTENERRGLRIGRGVIFISDTFPLTGIRNRD